MKKSITPLASIILLFTILLIQDTGAYYLDQTNGNYTDWFDNPDGIASAENATVSNGHIQLEKKDWDLGPWKYRSVYNIQENTGTTLYNYSTSVDVSHLTPTNGLVASYHFSEGNGTKVRDYSGNGNDGTIYGATWTRERYGNALLFDGVDDYVDAGTGSTLHVDTFTFTAWVKWSGKTNGDHDIIFNKEREYEWCIGDSGGCAPTGHVAWAIMTAGTWEWHDTGYKVPENEWTFLVLTYDGTNVKLYANGELKSTIADPDGGAITDSSYPLWIGRRQGQGTPSGEFSGAIDEIRIYNRVLSDEEIRQLYEATKARPDLGDIRTIVVNPSTGSHETARYYLDTDEKIWVEIPEIPANGNVTLLVYHGNPVAESESDESVPGVIFQDDFSSSTFSSYLNRILTCRSTCTTSDSMASITTKSTTYTSPPYGAYLDTGSTGFCGDAGLVKEITLPNVQPLTIEFKAKMWGSNWAGYKGVAIEKDGYGYGPKPCSEDGGGNYNNVYWLACTYRYGTSCGNRIDPETGQTYTPPQIGSNWGTFTADISRYAGQTIRIRLLVMDYSGTWCNMGDHPQRLWIDDIVIKRGSIDPQNAPTVTLLGEESRPQGARAESITIIPQILSGWETLHVKIDGGQWYKRRIVVREEDGIDREWYQVPVTMDTGSLVSAGKMRSDCGDLRFATQEGDIVPYWIASGCGTSNTMIWLRVPSIRANNETIIYAYYGNTALKSESDESQIGLFWGDIGESEDVYDFEGSTEGWSTAKHGDNGGTSIDYSTVFHGESSIKSYQPNTGSPSHHHFYINRVLPSPWFRVGWAAYVDGKQNSGSANRFMMEAIDSIDGGTYGFSVNSVYSGSSISAYDLSSGTWKTLKGSILDSWLWYIVEGDFARSEYYVILNGERYGPFGMSSGIQASDVPILELLNDNYLGYLDLVWIRKYYPPVTVFIGPEEPVNTSVGLLDGSTRNQLCSFDLGPGVHDIDISSCASGASTAIIEAEWGRVPPEYSLSLDEWGVSWNTNIPPLVEVDPSFVDHPGHSFDITSIGMDENGDSDLKACYVDIKKDSTTNTYSGVLDRNYGNSSEASCTLTVTTSMLGVGETALIRTRFVDYGGGEAASPWISHTMPNYAPSVESGPSFFDNTGEHSFRVEAVFNDPDGESDISSCTVYYSDGQGNDYSKSCVADTGYGNATQVSCSYSPIGTGDAGIEVGEPVSVWIECVDSGGLTARTTTGTHAVPNSPPATPQNPTLQASNTTRVTTLHPSISWSGVSDPEGDSIVIKAFLGDTSPPGTLDNQVQHPSTSMTLGETLSLERGKTYYWYIVACDNWDCSPPTTTQSFTINSLPVLEDSGINNTIPSGGDRIHVFVNLSEPDGDKIEYANFTIYCVTDNTIVNSTTNIPIDNLNGTYQGNGEWWSETFVVDSLKTYNWTLATSDGFETTEYHGSFSTDNSPPSCSWAPVFADAPDRHEFNASVNCTDQDLNDVTGCEFIIVDSQGNTVPVNGVLSQEDPNTYNCSLTVNNTWPSTYLEVREPLSVRARFYDAHGAFGESPTGVHSIPNKPPTITSVEVLPSNPNTTSTLSVQYSYVDPEGDMIDAVMYAWKRNGTDTGLSGPTVAYYETRKHENWSVSIKLVDSYGAQSEWASSGNVTIRNSPPVATTDTTGIQEHPHVVRVSARASDKDGKTDIVGCSVYASQGSESISSNGTLDCSLPGECECTSTISPDNATWILPLASVNVSIGFVDGDNIETNTSTITVTVPNRKPEITSTMPIDGTLTRNGTVMISWNALDPDGDPLNTTIELYHENRSIHQIIETTGNSTSNTLVDGEYYYRIIVTDGWENTTSQNNSIVVDTTPPVVEWNGTLPVEPVEDENVTCRWIVNDNGTGISNIRTYDNKTGEWTSVSSTSGIVERVIPWFYASPGLVNCTLTASDIAGNNATISRVFNIRDTTPPVIHEISLIPEDEESIDPGIVLNITSKITDNYEIENATLYYKTSNESIWNKKEMVPEQEDTYRTNITLGEGNYTLMIAAWDRDGNNATRIQNLTSLYDYSWRIDPDTATLFGIVGIESQNLTITIANTGDYPLGFVVGHTTGYLTPEVEVNYYGINPGETILVGAHQDKEFNISVVGLDDGMNVIMLTVECVNSTTPAHRTENITIEVGIGLEGPYLYVKAQDPAPTIPGSTIDLVFTMENIGTQTANHTGYKISLPEGWKTVGASIEGETGPIDVMHSVIVPIEIEVPGGAATGEYTIGITGIVYNETIETINTTDENNNTIQENLTILVPWRNTTRNVTVYVVDKGTGSTKIIQQEIVQEGGGKGGSQFVGGYFVPTPEQEDLLFQTTETIELVRGRDNSFLVRIRNPFENTTIMNATIEIEGYLSKYLSVSPSVIPEVPPGGEQAFTVTITAPRYMTESYYTLSCVIKAIVLNETSGATGLYTDEKTIILVIHSVSREEALALIQKAENETMRIKSMGLDTTRMEELLARAMEYYENREYARAAGLAGRVIELCNTANIVAREAEELGREINETREMGLKIPETERMYELAIASLERGDYETTAARLRDARSLLDLETKGQTNIFYYMIRYWWATLICIILALIGVYKGYLWLQTATISRRIKKLGALQEHLLEEREELKKKFSRGEMSQREYHERMARIEKRLAATRNSIASLRKKRVKLFNIDTEIRELEKEIEDLSRMIKNTQHEYYHARAITRDVYETRVRAYRERLAEARKDLEVYKQKKRDIEEGRVKEGEWIDLLAHKIERIKKRLVRGG